MKSGASESCYIHLKEYYSFPNDVFVTHIPKNILDSDKKYKIFWAQHAYDQPCMANFDHNMVDHIVSPSQWNKEMYIKYLNIPEDKITVIPSGVADMFSYSNKKTKSMIYTSIPYKGLEVLSKIIPKVVRRHPDVKFKIFSSMSLYDFDSDNYEELYETLKGMSNVEYSAAIDREDLVQHYQESAFFVHPNIWEETFCVSMTEAMRCGAYPIITNIGAISEVAGEKNALIIPIEGNPTPIGYKVTEDFLNNFANACCKLLDCYDDNRNYYHNVSKIVSDYVCENYNWKSIAEQWKTLIEDIKGTQMYQEKTDILSNYSPIDHKKAVYDEDYLQLAFENILRWEESDKEMSQGRTNFQIEKFIGLDCHNISTFFERILKERKVCAEGYMLKLIEMKKKVREFEYKWGEVEDKTKPILWDIGTRDKSKVLCWFDLDNLEMKNYLKSSEIEIRDSLYQMEHLDKMLNKAIEMNGGKSPDREQFLEESETYWDRRLAEQALDDLMGSILGISGANIQAMRRASAPSIVDQKNDFKQGYLPFEKLLEPNGKAEFIEHLQSKVLKGYEEISGCNDRYRTQLPEKEEIRKIGTSYFEE